MVFAEWRPHVAPHLCAHRKSASQLCSTAIMAATPSPACVKLRRECYFLQSCSLMLQPT